MLFDTQLFLGIDPCGGRKPFTYAALDARGRLVALGDGEMEDTLSFVAGLKAAQVAVNAPPRPSVGLVRQRLADQKLMPMRSSGRSLEMRLAEYYLREHGIQVTMTPARKELCPAWVQLGFAFYRKLESLGYSPRSPESPERAWLETHPQVTFCALLGQNPLPRATLEGRLQRQLILYEQGLEIRDPMVFFEEVTRHRLLKGVLPVERLYLPEQLDALAAACAAWLAARHPERVCWVGDAEEGQILFPAPALQNRY